MSSQASARQTIPEEPMVLDLGPDVRQPLARQLQIWKQVVFAEMLNWLEGRRYDLKPFRSS